MSTIDPRFNWPPTVSTARLAAVLEKWLSEPETALSTWQRLGRAGLVVSIVYGPMQGPPHPRLGWSVTVFDPRTRESFQRPYEARDFAHAVQIAEIECRERGWYTE